MSVVGVVCETVSAPVIVSPGAVTSGKRVGASSGGLTSVVIVDGGGEGATGAGAVACSAGAAGKGAATGGETGAAGCAGIVK